MSRAQFLLVMLLCLITVPVLAQQQTGELVIKATDPSGAVIADATITLTSTALIRPVEGTTDSTGTFRATALPSGTYKVNAAKTGFAKAVRDNVTVQLGRSFAIEMPLKVGASAETVEVSSSAVQIDTFKSESSDAVQGGTMLSVPGTRDFADYAKLTPSVNNETMAAGISVDGASGSENVFYVDGVDTSNMYTGQNNQSVRPEIVQELQLKSGGYEAEFGGAMGGVLSVVTKSGNNNFHGQFYYYNSGSGLTGAERNTLRLNLANEKESEYIKYPKDHSIRNEFGFNLGGPIWRDKAWFFVNLNPSFENTSREVRMTDVSGVQHLNKYERRDTTRSGLAKIDFQPWQRVRLFASYTQDTSRYKGELPSRAGTDAFEFNYALAGYKYPSYTFTGGATFTVTPKFLIDTRYGFNGSDVIQFVGPSEPTWLFRTSNDAIGVSASSSLYRPSGFYNQFPNDAAYKTTQNYQKKMNYVATASLNANFLGSHNFRGGYQFNRWVHDIADAHPYDYVRFNWGRTYESPISGNHASSCVGPDAVTYNPCGYVEVRSPFGTVAKIHTDHHALFFQDSWTIGRRLTISPGIRFEKEEIPSFSDLPQFKGAAFSWGFKDKVAPRLGASFDLFGNGKAKVYGSWGWFYDMMKLSMAEGSFGGFKWHSQYYLINQAVADDWTLAGGAHDPAGFSTNCTGSTSGGAVSCGPLAGMPFIEDLDWRIPSFDTLDPDLKAMRMSNAIVGTEIELKKDYIFSFQYVHKQIDRAIEDVGVQTPLGEEYFITNPGYGYSVSKFVAAGMPATPKATRNYNAWEFRLRKPYSNNWTLDASYTYSRLRGNYSGLASSDEDTANGVGQGRTDPNVARYFDLWFLNYDASGKLVDGPLNTDRPHQIKMNGQYQMPKRLPAIGFFFQALSGTPITTEATFNSAEMMVNNRGDMGRLPWFTQTDVFLRQTFKPFKNESKSVEFSVNVTNLFNQATEIHRYRLYNRASVNLPYAGMNDASNLANVNKFLQQGFDWKATIDAANTISGGTVVDPRYNKGDLFQSPVAVRLGFRFNF
ncbi:MAG TPA: carboxypeptidase regulatory-like domain-containing protein [Clostridia bacterium]|nr:carboxypeptidase regulatory-like domain-containing protein [Clostridia bacterium]